MTEVSFFDPVIGECDPAPDLLVGFGSLHFSDLGGLGQESIGLGRL